ncbi:MAG: hypothetical protein IJW47_04585 [Clostridia bacterium]|nr:hypothetical protein [Clostridia bacterium]
MTILFITKRDAFSSQGGIFGFWGIIVLILCVLMFKEFVASFFKKQPIISVSIVLLIVGLFAEFLATYLALIGIVSGIAGIASSVVSVVADVYSRHSYKTVNDEKVINKGVAISQKEAWREAYGYNFFTTQDGGGE